jgi:hypothetical protein
MVVPHYTYLVLKMPGPKGIIIVKGSFELSNICDKEFHKMAQNFGMIANYGEPKDKAKITNIGADKPPEGYHAEPETKKPRVQVSKEDKATREEEKTPAA